MNFKTGAKMRRLRGREDEANTKIWFLIRDQAFRPHCHLDTTRHESGFAFMGASSGLVSTIRILIVEAAWSPARNIRHGS
jgi:hypothetical protein